MKKFFRDLGIFTAGAVFALGVVFSWIYLSQKFDPSLFLAEEAPETVFIPAESETKPETQYCARFTVNTSERFWFDGDMQCPCDHDFSVASDLGNHWCVYGASDLEVTALGDSRVASQHEADMSRVCSPGRFGKAVLVIGKKCDVPEFAILKGDIAEDDDMDGYSEVDGDCDDLDPEIYPGHGCE